MPSVMLIALTAVAVDGADPKPLAEQLNVDVSIPTNPGLAIVGADPSGLTQITAFPDLGAQLGSYMDAQGRVQPGFAFSLSPYWIRENRITIDEYSGLDRLTRIAARTQLSVAGVGDGDSGARLGLGLHTQLLDLQDPRYIREESGASVRLASCLEPLNRAAGDREIREDDPELFALLPDERRAAALAWTPELETACYTRAESEFLDQAGWTAGLGLAFAGGSDFSDLETDGVSVWTAYRHPLGEGPGELTVRGRYQSEAEFEVTGGMLDGSEASISLVYAEERSGRRWELVADYTVRDYEASTDPAVIAPDEDGFLTVGARYLTQVRDGVWLEFGYLSVPDGGLEYDDRVTVQLKLDLSSN